MYYERDKLFFHKEEEKNIVIDAPSFELAGNPDPAIMISMYDPHSFAAKDKNHIYSANRSKIEVIHPEIDILHFEFLGGKYAKDENFVYQKSGMRIDNRYVYDYVILKDRDVETFEALGWGYTKDKDFVYYDDTVLEGVDVLNFEVLDEGYAKNENFVYLHGKVLENKDAKTFEGVKNEYTRERYTKDKNFVYFNDEKLENVDPQGFEVIDWHYTKNNHQVYYDNTPVLGDPKSIKILKGRYSKDDKKVYYAGKIIEGADPQTFRVSNDWDYAKDKNSYYFHHNRVSMINYYKNVFDESPYSGIILTFLFLFALGLAWIFLVFIFVKFKKS